MNIQTTINHVKAIAEIAGDIDFANAKSNTKPEITELVGKLHSALITLLGEQARLVYAPDDGGEYDPRS